MKTSSTAKLYSRAKGLEILTRVLGVASARQLNKMFVPWTTRCRWQKRWEQEAATVEIQSVVRRFLGKRKVLRIRKARYSIIIQCSIRTFLARRRVARRRRLILLNDSANKIKTWLRGRVEIQRAKKRVQSLRELRSIKRIQRVWRGALGSMRVRGVVLSWLVVSIICVLYYRWTCVTSIIYNEPNECIVVFLCRCADGVLVLSGATRNSCSLQFK